MSIRVFAHDANPAVDRHCYTRDRDSIISMIHSGRVRVLRDAKGKEWAVQYVAGAAGAERTLAGQLAAFLTTVPDVGAGGQTAEELLDLFKGSDSESNASISDGEMKANAGGVDGEFSEVEILRAQAKVKAWPFVGDDKAVRVGVACWA